MTRWVKTLVMRRLVLRLTSSGTKQEVFHLILTRFQPGEPGRLFEVRTVSTVFEVAGGDVNR